MNKLKFWINNARHISLPQSMLPCILAISMSLIHEDFSWWLALLAVAGVACAHLGMNLADDWFDYKVGSGEKRKTMASEGMRARIHKYPYLTSGEATLKELAIAIIAFLTVAVIIGGIVIIFRGLVPLYLMIAGGFLGICYSGWPFHLSYHGYGELVIGLMFGPLLMIGVQYASCGVFDWSILIVSIAVGLLVTNIVYSHSVLDRTADAQMDKLTLARLLKDKKSMLAASAIFNFLPFLLIIIGACLKILHPAYLSTLILLPMAAYLWNSLRLFVYEKDTEIKIQPWMGPMGDFKAYREYGIDWFMLRWLMARNLISFFSLILVVVNIILKIIAVL